MTSELLFSAARKVDNRYLLCRLTSKTVRRLHFASSNTKDAIVDAFTRIGTPDTQPMKFRGQENAPAS